MKIGLSYGKCVRDIVSQVVKIEDVLLIVTRTALEDRSQIKQMASIYGNVRDYWYGLDLETCTLMAELLWDMGKIYQPRLIVEENQLFNRWAESCSEGGIWLDLVHSYTGDNEMAAEAYRNYLMVRKLVE